MMRITGLLIIISMALSIAAVGQFQQAVATIEKDSFDLKIYQQALQIGDYKSAILAANYLSLHHPEKYNNWQDTIALLLYRDQNYKSAFALADTLLTHRGISDLRLEIKAAAAKALNDDVDALINYTLLFNKTKKPVYGFEEMKLEYRLKEFSQAILTGKNILIVTKQTKDLSTVEISKANGMNVQTVFLEAAIDNLIGACYIQLNDKNSSVQYIQNALQIQPDFELAKSNLELAPKKRILK